MDKFTLRQEDAVLLVIDIQERLVPVMAYGPKVIRNTNILVAVANKLEIPVVVTEQYPQGLGKTVAEVSDCFGKALVCEKTTFSAVTDEVAAILRRLGKQKVILVGMETHVCVLQTARDLLADGYHVFVVRDAVCSRTEENYLNGLSLISAMGVVVTNTETVVFDLMKEAGTPIFKEISKLIK